MRAAPEIDVPKIDVKSGGKVSGYGERLEVSLVTGAASVSIPIPAPKLRDCAPDLALSYGGGTQNGPCGIGFAIDVPSVSRLTDKGIPRYDGQDIFLLGGQELTPRYTAQGTDWIKDERQDGAYWVVGYRPRIETTWNRIEFWSRPGAEDSFWKVVDSDNTTTIYGHEAGARIADPQDPQRVFKWTLSERRDAHGNRILYDYEREDGAGLPAGAAAGSQLYIRSIRYGNHGTADDEQFAAEILFDYGEYDLPALDRVRPWPVRQDPFSTYKPGFELRTWRLCRNVMTLSHFPDEPGVGTCLTRVLALTYDESPGGTTLRSVQEVGWRRLTSGQQVSAAKPAATFAFGAFEPGAGRFRPLEVAGLPPAQGLLGAGHYQLTDLYGDGIPGILYNEASTLAYWRALGDARYQPPEILPHFPIDTALAAGRCSLMDLSGAGHQDLVVHTTQRAGFYRNNNDGTWESFVPFAGYPPEMTAPGAQFADLDGDGRQDVMIAAGPRRIRRYGSDGIRGFGPAGLHPTDAGFPAAPAQGEGEVAAFVDIFGDGLQHRVKLTDGSLVAWPTLGYGRFGAPVTFANVPRFSASLTARRIFFADVTGSGLADLVFVHATHLAIHRNQSGNGFSDPLIVAVPARVDDLDQINWADVFGDGLSAFVLSKAGSRVEHQALSFATGETPYLLKSIDNGYGAQTTLRYRSSTHFQLADRAAGRPWPTTLSNVMQVVDTLTVSDRSTGLVSTSRYQYADGYFDSVEREFRGFGFVQSQDSQVFSPELWHFPEAPDPDTRIDTGPPLEPCLTRRWNNTGAARLVEARSTPLPQLDGAPLVPRDVLAGEIFTTGGDTLREAYRALKDHEAAKSTAGIAPDGVPMPVAYQVSAQNYAVGLLQPRIAGHRAAFQVLQRHSRTVVADAAEARIADAFNLAADAYGNITLSAAIAYPRKSDAALPQQAQLLASATQRSFINHPETVAEPFRSIGLQWQEQVLEIGGLDAAGGLLDFAAVAAACETALAAIIPYGTAFSGGSLQARPYQWTRDLYWNADQTTPLPFGETTGLMLLYEQHKAMFPEGFVTSVFGDKVGAAQLEASDGAGAGYVLADGYWWNPGIRRSYQPASGHCNLAAAADPFGAAATFGFDPYGFEIVSSTDALGQAITITIDYQALQPRRVVDVNGNTTETTYGPLASMLAFSRYGVIDGVSVGDKPLDDYVYVAPASRAEILADPEKFLQGAGSYYWEDLFATADGRGPVSSIHVEANRAVKPADAAWDPAPRTYGCSLSFVDGAMRSLCRQDRIDAGGVAAAEGWVVLEQQTYDGQGRVIRRYNPYILSAPDFVVAPEVPFARDWYDALGRQVRSEQPTSFFSTTQYGAWARVVSDPDDTILSSAFYQANIGNLDPAFANERDALLKAAAFADTPTTFCLDPLGRDILERKINIFVPGPVSGNGSAARVPVGDGVQEVYETATWRDLGGAALREADPRFYAGAETRLFNQQRTYDMAGKVVRTLSTDRGKATPGTQLDLHDALGNLLHAWSNDGTHVRRAFDVLRRFTGSFVTPGGGTLFQAESLAYGTDASFNTRNRVVLRRDQAEEAAIAAYSLTEQPTRETRRFPVAVGGPLDWSDPDKVTLLPDVWRLGAVHNRRGWPLAVFNADGSVQTLAYYVNGWRRSVGLAASATDTPASVMTSRSYSPAGAARDSIFANATTASRSYDPASQRLTGIRLARLGDGAVLQDDAVYYDAVGNVTRILHKAELPDTWGNGTADPLCDYTYDALYRLRVATGRQQADLAAANALPVPGLGAGDDPGRLVAYTETYGLDRSNNVTEIRHVADAGAGQGSWTKTFTVSATSNHAVPADMLSGSATPDDFYDLSGNLCQLPNVPAVAFSYRNQMATATLVVRADNDDDVEAYAYAQSGERRRKTVRRFQGGGVTGVEDTFYIGNLVLTRRARVSGGTTTPVGEGASLSVSAGSERLLVVDRDSLAPGAQRRYQAGNHQASVTLELDDAGLALTYEEYLPYGGAALTKSRSQLDGDRKRYRFIGKERDAATGLYCIGLRSYIPSMGRWLTTDPAGTKDGLNLYGYTGANPTTYVDRTGLARTRLTGPANLVATRQNQNNADHDRAVGMVDAAIDLLQAQVESRNGWLVSTLWSRGTINEPDPLVRQFFGIRGHSRTDANNLIELLDNFRAIKAYLTRPPVESRLSWRYAQSFFVNTPQFNVLQDPPNNGTIAYIQGASLNWPDWSILPNSWRSRPMGPLSVIGLVNPAVNAIRRFTPSDGINLYAEAHFGDNDNNKRASTIVHEASHLVVNTADHAYGFEGDTFRNLSTTQTLYNADSYGLFAQAVYEREHHIL